MLINSKKISYFLYSAIVYLIYIQTSNITPPSINWMANKLLYLSIFLLLSLTLYKSQGKVHRNELTPLLLLFFYFIFSSISFLFTLSLDQAIIKSFSYGFQYLVLLYIGLYLVKTLSTIELFKPFIISSIVIIILSFLVYFGYRPTFYAPTQEALDRFLELKFGGSLIGFSGVYLNQNTLGASLIIAISSIYAVILTNLKSRLYKKILYIFLFLALILLFLTTSRGAIISVLTTLLLFTLKNYRNRISVYFMILFSAIVVFTYIYFYQYIELLINRVENDGTSSRTDIWIDALNSFYSNPLFGVGEYSYIYTAKSGASLSAHNVYIDQLASIGLIPSIFWFLWLLYGLKYVLKTFTTIKRYFRYDVLIASTFIGVLIHQSVETFLRNPQLPLTIFFIVIYSYGVKKNIKKI